MLVKVATENIALELVSQIWTAWQNMVKNRKDDHGILDAYKKSPTLLERQIL